MPELLNRLQVALADRYRIEGEIGAGGMATVYLAQDLRHDRKVALKLLRPELSAVIGAERFLAEIKLTANLQHPHILPLFDSGEADSYLFYVMPFVEGESLRSRLNREKQLPVAEAVRIATEVASALDYAHRHGVVHRDIKPENILLHDGRALVADFGIALAASKAGGNRMTETGMSLGTPFYMSPEQAMGEREITARSDVYALGVVLYEMLTGDPPFTGSTAQAVVARVLTEAPRPILPQRHTIPPEIEVAVLTALEKLPADRFGTAAEFAESLAGRRTVPVRTRAPSGGAATAVTTRLDPVKLALAGVALVFAGAAAWGWLRAAPAPDVNRFSLYLPSAEALAPVSTSGNRVAISPDGRRLVYVGPASGGTQLWLRDHDQLISSPIPGTENAGSPFFSPRGREIGFLVGGTKIRTVSLDGGPTQTLSDSINSTLVRSPFAFAHALQTHDGKWLLARRSFLEAGAGDIYGVRAGDSTLVPLVTGPATEIEPAVSPDGKWLAYASNESGSPEVYVRPFPDAGSARWQVSIAGGRDPLWSHSGRELFYLSSANRLMSVAIHPGAAFAFDQPKPLFSTASYAGGGPVQPYDVSPDDKRFLFMRETSPNQKNELIVVQNWSRELEARARK